MITPITLSNRQAGVALILVLVILALVSLIATQIVGIRGIYSQRTQNILQAENAWGYAVGAEKLAGIALRQSLKDQDTVALGQPWASQAVVFPIEGGQLSAALVDLKGCFNVNMITEGGASQDGQSAANDKPLAGERILTRLIALLPMPEQALDVNAPALAARLRDWIDANSVPSGFEGREDEEYTGYNQPYRTANQTLASVSELRTISGFEPEVVAWLSPYLCAIPQYSELTINVNTIPLEQPELLASFYDNLPVETASSILAGRPEDGYTEEDYNPLLPADAKLVEGASIVYDSNYFAALIEVELGNTKTRLKSLLFYEPAKPAVQILARMGHND